MKKSLLLLLTAAVALGGCSSFSKSARQQRAYAKYVRKTSVARVKQSHRFFHSDKPHMPMSPTPSNPVMTTQSGPQAVPSDQ